MIELDSLSYKYNKEIVKYYLLINFYLFYNSDYYPILIGDRKPNSEKHELMEIIEDNGLNETISKKIEINIDLINGINSFYIIPIFENTNLILKDYIIDNQKFNYTNIPKEENNNILWYILIPIIIIIIIIIVILFYIMCRKRASKDITMDNTPNEELINMEK